MSSSSDLSEKIEVIISDTQTVSPSLLSVIVVPFVAFLDSYITKGYFRLGTKGFVMAVTESMIKFIILGNSYVKGRR